ncbi:MAG: hypothetical protein GF329_17680 [Candidatus Lokiarchaeota archaeon]|nr:hypothetical protein [Candidatus Lokiarchaeota archaeon]
MRQCKICGSITFGGYCPVCGTNRVKLRFDQKQIFQSDDWIKKRVNAAKQVGASSIITPQNKEVKKKPNLEKKIPHKYENRDKILEYFENKAQAKKIMADHVSLNQKLNFKWIERINKDSGFIENVSSVFKKELDDEKKIKLQHDSKKARKEIDDLIIK